MKSKLITIALMLLCVTPIFAMTQDVDVSNAASLVAYLSTFIVLAAAWVFNKVFPVIPGWATLLVVTGLSALLTFLTNKLGDPSLTWLAQFGLGLAATFVHQLALKFTSSK